MIGKLTLTAVTLAAASTAIVVGLFAAIAKIVTGAWLIPIETTIELALLTFAMFSGILLCGYLSAGKRWGVSKRDVRTQSRSVGGNEGFITSTRDTTDTGTSSEPVGIHRDSEQDTRHSARELVLPNGE